jgi:Na+/H+ antiporter NhaD/arsenite permease-like protein
MPGCIGPATRNEDAMNALSAGITTGGDFTMWGSLTLLCVLGLAAAWSDRWFRKHSREA